MNEKFVVSAVYTQPSFEELKRRFPDYVDLDFENSCFVPIERCKDVSREDREIVLECIKMNLDSVTTLTDEVLAEMDRRGLRPALYEELLSFAEKYPAEQMKHPFVALGSEMLVDGERCVAYLWYEGDGRSIDLYQPLDDWHDYFRFLAVRK